MVVQLLMGQFFRVLPEAMPLLKPISSQLSNVFFLMLLPLSLLTSLIATILSSPKQIFPWPAVGQQKQHVGDAVCRALTHVLQLLTDLPTSSPKYAFTQGIAEDMLRNNAAQKMPLLAVNRFVLSRAFLRTAGLLEATLRRGQSSSQIGQIIERYSSWTAVSDAASSDSERAEKLSKELLWLVEKLDECGGIEEAVLHMARASSLSSAALSANSRVQASLVKLAALCCRSTAAADFCMVPLDAQFRLLFIWMPLLCRAMHGGDGPIFSIREKQDTEEALQRIISLLSHEKQELIFAAWLQEYSWSASDWPNLSSSYSLWCDRARELAMLMC